MVSGRYQNPQKATLSKTGSSGLAPNANQQQHHLQMGTLSERNTDNATTNSLSRPARNNAGIMRKVQGGAATTAPGFGTGRSSRPKSKSI